jgi:outer membrane receptor protein involved in Fe transport
VLPGGGPVYIPTTAFANYVLSQLTATNPGAAPFYQKAFSLYNGASGASRATPVTLANDASGAYGCGDFAGTAGFGTATTPCARTFRSTVNNLNTEWLMTARVDYALSGADRIYFRYNTDHGVQATGTDPINPAFNANSIQPSYGGQFGYTRVISPTMVNQLLLSASYYTAIFGPPNLSNALSTFPTTFTFADGLYSNLGGSDNAYPQGRKVRQWQLIDDYAITHGNHTFKFGTNVRKNWISTYAYGANTSGVFTFNSMTDFANGNLANGSTYAQAFTSIGAENLTMYSAGFYGQDEWKVTPSLTLTLAVRMDRNSNITCGAGCFNEFATQPFGQLAHTATTPYNATIKTGLTQAFPNLEPIVPEPRVGLAWNATKSTVIRTGFGIFSDLYQGLIADRLITNSPAVASFTTSNGIVATGVGNTAQSFVANSYNAFRNGFASGATVAQLQAAVTGFSKPNFNTVGNELYNPKYYEWNFEVQQELRRNFLLSLNYVGNRGYQELNQTLFANAYSTTGAEQQRVGSLQRSAGESHRTSWVTSATLGATLLTPAQTTVWSLSTR